jgi:methyl-accepting chemotaxis protein
MWSIKRRMIVMASAAVVGLTVLAGIQAMVGKKVNDLTTSANALRADLQQLSQMRLANMELVLAAMDTIVDKDEGQVQPERVEVVRDSVEFIRSRFDLVAAVAKELGMSSDVAEIPATFDTLTRAIQVDLVKAVEGRAEQAAFTKLDDVIDGAGEHVADLLAQLAHRGQEVLSDRLDSAAEAVRLSFIATVVAYLIALATLLPLMFFIARGIIRALGRLSGTMERLAEGDTDAAIEGAERRDEIGRMAATVRVFRDNAIDKARLDAAQRSEQEARDAKAQRLIQLCASFDEKASAALATVGSAADGMHTVARTMLGIATQSSEQSVSAAGATEQAATNVQAVAASAEELSSSIAEIGRQVGHSLDVAQQATEATERTTTTAQSLAESTQKIGDVVNLISDIAAQTNLLALNATIEAARAGESGKGFAVVASEVKSLANQTAKATEEIAAQIGDVQSATAGMVQAIEQTRDIITALRESAATIHASVEEQSQATSEISRHAQEAAGGTQQVAGNIASVQQAARETGTAAEQVLDASGGLVKQAEALRETVDAFLGEVRAA